MALFHCHFFSEALGMCQAADVILPQGGPGWADDRRYPTLYLLHGHSDDETIWQRRTAVERYVDGLELAVVMPRVDRSFYCDMHAGLRYFTYVADDLPRVMRSFFPLSARREDNFVAGLSMGGYGAMKLALTHPDRYAAAASLSGALDMVGRAAEAREGLGDVLTLAFGPAEGLVGGPNDLLHLASALRASGQTPPRLYAWCGVDDFLYQHNLTFRDHLAAIGLPLTWEEGPGGHTWDRWDVGLRRVLEWLGLAPKA